MTLNIVAAVLALVGAGIVASMGIDGVRWVVDKIKGQGGHQGNHFGNHTGTLMTPFPLPHPAPAPTAMPVPDELENLLEGAQPKKKRRKRAAEAPAPGVGDTGFVVSDEAEAAPALPVSDLVAAALAAAPLEAVEIPDEKQITYLLLDTSPSMFGEVNGVMINRSHWAIPVWRGIADGYLAQARQAGKRVMLRHYGRDVYPLQEAVSPETEQQTRDYLYGLHSSQSTDTPRALAAVAGDLGSTTYDAAEVVLITDTHEKFRIRDTKKLLAGAKATFTVLMIEAENPQLARIAAPGRYIELTRRGVANVPPPPDPDPDDEPKEELADAPPENPPAGAAPPAPEGDAPDDNDTPAAA